MQWGLSNSEKISTKIAVAAVSELLGPTIATTHQRLGIGALGEAWVPKRLQNATPCSGRPLLRLDKTSHLT